MNGFWAAVTRNGARTDRRSPDAALRGRTYSIPFDRVWNAALALTSGEHRGWRVVAYDDLYGEIHAIAPRRLIGEKADVRVRVRLDDNGQTRVDVESKSRDSARDWGANRQRIRRFIKALDHKLGATSEQILSDPVELTPAG